MFKKVLVANRGAIAVRIIQAIQELGLTAVAIYSTPDERSLHLHWADETYHIPGEVPQDTYLNIHAILDIAKKSKVDAIHPGYGFLSENAEFAEKVNKAGITFVGPSPEAIRSMGLKTEARRIMQLANVPIVPGYQGEDRSTKTLLDKAEEIGYPILVKASAGGGGKGMKIVQVPSELETAVESAKREALKAFGDDTIYLEKYLEEPRHIEVQILGDHSGNIIHLFERECSIQRRHQKILEEAPSIFLTPKIRENICCAAVNAAKAVNYVNAGTVEFIVDKFHNFYFLEMNTRLQVEHSVTEMTTGVDIVKLQLKIAAGESLPFSQNEILQKGHSIEVRIYAEDPVNNFLPSTGIIRFLEPPIGVNIRNDLGIHAGVPVTLFYDPLLAKLTVFDSTRTTAIEKLKWAIDRYGISGIRTNIPFLREIVNHPEFIKGNTTTNFIEKFFSNWNVPHQSIPDEAFALAALSEYINQEKSEYHSSVDFESDPFSPWIGE
ncbi:MAG: acetyl-CoA carboxylase biotin carboxylase subunit [bacterium]|nr:acetyl-CoA carboxylase biotin carboxylase subunit [bacterium]